jgi:hypothetical protein
MGNTIQTLLSDIAKFMNQYTSEVVVIEASHFYGTNPEAEQILVSIIQETFGSLLLPRPIIDWDNTYTGNNIVLSILTVEAFPTIGNMVAKNQRVFFLYDGNINFVSQNGFLWPHSIYYLVIIMLSN